MKGMASAQGQKAAPTDGRYMFLVTGATPGFTQVRQTANGQKGGDSKISLAMEICEGEFTGYPAFDELGTDGGTNFGAMSKKRLRQLDVPGLDTDAETPDDVIAASLLNRKLLVEVKREQREDADGNKQWDIDEKTGVKVPLYRLRVIGYIRQPTAQATPGAPHVGLPTGAPQLPQGYPTAQGIPQGYAAPAFPGAPGVPQGFAPPPPGAVPGGFAPQAAPGYPQVAPPPGWNGAAAAPGMPGGQPQLSFNPGAPGIPGAPR